MSISAMRVLVHSVSPDMKQSFCNAMQARILTRRFGPAQKGTSAGSGRGRTSQACAPLPRHDFLFPTMNREVPAPRQPAWASPILAITLMTAVSGCYYAGFFAYQAEGGGTDAAVGEEHQMNFSAEDTFVLTQDALRGEGVLFQVRPQDSLET